MNLRQYEQLKTAIKTASIDIECRNTSMHLKEPFSGIINYRDNTIRLADVLIVMNVKNSYIIDAKGYFYLWEDESVCQECNWNLKNNSLDSQSEKTKEFLYSLLCK